MRSPRLAPAFCLALLATAACNPHPPGSDNLRRAEALLSTQPTQALHEHDLAAKAGADGIEVKKGLAAAYERLNDLDKAVALPREVTAKATQDLDAKLALARVLVLKRDFDGALATALDQSGNAQEASTVLADLLTRYAGFPPAVLLLAKISLEQKQPDRAI